MKNVPLTVLFGVAVIAVPLMLARAGVDPNDDGCVDLADYAIMQQGFTGPDCGGKEIHSFYRLANGAGPIIPVVPGENGFIITDLVCRHDRQGAVVATLVETFGDEMNTKLRFHIPDLPPQVTLHFNSGIPVRSGASVTVSGMELVDVTVSGYTY
jgi:hypothetical protein